MTLNGPLLAAFAALVPLSAQAHFVLPYADNVQIDRPGDLPLALVFWHPFENGHVMDMEVPHGFYMIHNGDRIDLADRLEATPFQGAQNTGAGFRATLPVKRSGDYVLVTEPVPYLEPSEDKYIQQFTKVVFNRNGLPTDWADPVGLPTEILPLVKPYNVLAGSTFSGQVLRNGAPAAGIEIEVEYVAAVPDLDSFAAKPPTVGPMPGGAVVVVTDANGYFSFGVPRAGWWGFAALGSGPVTEHDGKELSQDAVFWIRAYGME
ncbi:DUF4198 domain-containing protein [Pseudooceanicola sp. MF1-13]|uniref:DUF4198 domain-containing protein n=1 Tax=Pseudooceanicola sp. MF1-13 TaxID=3379095 RepID=UPI003891903F